MVAFCERVHLQKLGKACDGGHLALSQAGQGLLLAFCLLLLFSQAERQVGLACREWVGKGGGEVRPKRC